MMCWGPEGGQLEIEQSTKCCFIMKYSCKICLFLNASLCLVIALSPWQLDVHGWKSQFRDPSMKPKLTL